MRKVLSFVLVLSLVLGSFSMAFAAPATQLSDIAGSVNEEAIQVNNDLGIIEGYPDGKFLPDQNVNRAEFAAMITRAMAIPESALAGYTSTTFKDTDGYGWAVPYLAFMQSKGIMIGDGNGNAMPGRTINMNEAVTMALRAIGYTENSAELVGAWPAKYVTVAQNNGIYDDVKAAFNVDRASAAQVIYNLLTVEKVAVNADGETKGLGVSLLTSGLNCEEEDAAVIRGSESSVINLMPYMGAYAIAYTNTDDEIVAIGEVKSTFLTGEKSGSKFKADGVEYDVPSHFEEGAYYFDNAKADNSASEATFALPASGEVTLAVDKSGRVIKKIYSEQTWTVTRGEVVDAAALEALDDDELLGEDFDLNDDKEIDMNSFALVGVKSLKDIKKDNVVYVYVNEATDKIAKVAVGTEKVTGKVTEVDGDKYVVNGEKYEIADANGFEKTTAINAGDTITADLDAYGDIFDFELDKASPDTYAIAQFFAAKGIDDAKIRLYTSDDATKTFAIDEDTRTTGLSTGEMSKLIGYSIDNNGKIDAIDLEASTIDAATVVTLQSISVVKVGNETLPINTDVVVFTYDSDDGYDVTTIDKVKNDRDLNGNDSFQYILDEDNKYVVAMVVDAAAAGKTADDTYGVINKVTTTVNEDDDVVQRLQGFAAGVSLDSLTTKDKILSNDTVDEAVYLYLVDFDADNNVTGVTTKSALATADGVTIGAINSARTAIQTTDGGVWISLADNVVVYEVEDIGTNDMTYKVSSKASLRAANNYKFWAYDTDADEPGVEVIIFTR